MSKRMRALHVYTGKGYGTVDASMLDNLYKKNIFELVVHLGNMEKVKFDYQLGTSHQNEVIDQMISDLKDFLPEFRASRLWSKSLYISLPALNNNISTIQNVDKFYSFYLDFLKKAKKACIDILGSDALIAFVDGFYFRTETIFPIDQKISATKPTSNKMVKLLNDLAFEIRNTYEVQFMWCPYYGYGTYADNITHNLGIIANRTDIFDIICIQPQYYFQGSAYKKNVDRVYTSAFEKNVVDINGNPVGGGRTSFATALIGVNMEADDNFRSSRKAEFDYYIQQFQSLTSKAPMVFYCGSTANLVKNTPLVNAIRDLYVV
ncbi:hypothetical protein QNK09_03185 [Brevibacillus agri]|uniref:hypothetical protein n=1 Tax=Brevibacillus agri TaxID=51101 RepID=UPI0024C02928|nr:hypothetical protein [Brevibacillus agri]WHX31262.1 hypothetical protein QNK09_03185 [Brevibacillus agri]